MLSTFAKVFYASFGDIVYTLLFWFTVSEVCRVEYGLPDTYLSLGMARASPGLENVICARRTKADHPFYWVSIPHLHCSVILHMCAVKQVKRTSAETSMRESSDSVQMPEVSELCWLEIKFYEQLHFC